MNTLDRQRRMLAGSLSALAGYVDAVGFLSAKGYFVSFMSGNTTRLAVDLIERVPEAITPALLITGFVAGVVLGSVVGSKAGRWRKPAVLGVVSALLGAGVVLAACGMRGACLAMLVISMGALNNTFVRNGEQTLGLTYMTGTLVKLGQSIAALIGGEQGDHGWAYVGLWVALAIGAVAGAAAFSRFGSLALGFACGTAVLITGISAFLCLRPQSPD